jgi:hypothetical protein
MQQARNPCAKEAVEVVRNHEGGTRPTDWFPSAEGGGDVTGSRRTGDPAVTVGQAPAVWQSAKVGWLGASWVGRMRGMELTQLERIPREAGADAVGNDGRRAPHATGALKVRRRS